MIRSLALAVVSTSVLTATASAATFPGDAAYVPWRCRGEVMFDALGDQPPALAERDLVGDRDAAAGLRAADADFLYLRIRVDQDAAPGGVVRPYAWGMELDLDGDRSTYELLITVDGIGAPDGVVSVFTNDTTTLANSPADPADGPAVATFPFADAARVVATSTMIGANTDFFVDIAVPWTALIPLGLDRDTPVYVWAGTSSVRDALDGDIACHDGRTGGARLDAVVSDRTTGDPTRDPGNGGGGGGGAGIPRLEGGGGCQTGGPVGIGVMLALLGLRRRRRCVR